MSGEFLGNPETVRQQMTSAHHPLLSFSVTIHNLPQKRSALPYSYTTTLSNLKTLRTHTTHDSGR